MKISCANCGHRFDPGGDDLASCPSCGWLVDTRPITYETEKRLSPEELEDEISGVGGYSSGKGQAGESTGPEAKDEASGRQTEAQHERYEVVVWKGVRSPADERSQRFDGLGEARKWLEAYRISLSDEIVLMFGRRGGRFRERLSCLVFDTIPWRKQLFTGTVNDVLREMAHIPDAKGELGPRVYNAKHALAWAAVGLVLIFLVPSALKLAQPRIDAVSPTSLPPKEEFIKALWCRLPHGFYRSCFERGSLSISHYSCRKVCLSLRFDREVFFRWGIARHMVECSIGALMELGCDPCSKRVWIHASAYEPDSRDSPTGRKYVKMVLYCESSYNPTKDEIQ
ncbi:hypothetical protein J7M28_05460 [bacterium]|nr:hypothetical protein [bacterium]